MAASSIEDQQHDTWAIKNKENIKGNMNARPTKQSNLINTTNAFQFLKFKIFANIDLSNSS